MELTGLNPLLIIFVLIALFIILIFLISLIQNRLFDREKILRNQMKDKGVELKKAVKQKKKTMIDAVIEKGACPSKEQMDAFRRETKVLLKEYLRFSWSILKKTLKIHNEESGFSDTEKELKKNIGNSYFIYLGSMLLTPIAVPILIGLTAPLREVFESSRTSQSSFYYLILLLLPAIGCWIAYRGYARIRQKKALLLCLFINAVYIFFIIYGILRIGNGND